MVDRATVGQTLGVLLCRNHTLEKDKCRKGRTVVFMNTQILGWLESIFTVVLVGFRVLHVPLVNGYIVNNFSLNCMFVDTYSIYNSNNLPK